MIRVPVNPRLLRWARERAELEAGVLERRFPKLPQWERGETRPTLRQLEDFAKATRAPLGYLFLPEPPVEQLPIPDFRTVAGAGVARPSPDLLETAYICEQRQEWYRDFARSTGEAPLPFVGSLTVKDNVVAAASEMRTTLKLDLERRRELATWSEALREFIGQADERGILVMSSGIVGSNTHRKLDPQEFRGFAMADPLAPVVFINGADTRAAQMFTLAHELAHIWLGQSAVSDASPAHLPNHEVERWCNRVAAELLVPLSIIDEELRRGGDLHAEMDRLARLFKVSTLVILRRLHDVAWIDRSEMREAYEGEIAKLRALTSSSGGNFYLTLPARVSKRFARALVESTVEGRTLYRDALRMFGFSKMATFDELGRRLGVII